MNLDGQVAWMLAWYLEQPPARWPAGAEGMNDLVGDWEKLGFKKVQPSGDLYATAATLYYLITSAFIYDQASEGGDLIRTLLEEPPIPIETRRPDVPSGLAQTTVVPWPSMLESCSVPPSLVIGAASRSDARRAEFAAAAAASASPLPSS